MNINWVYFSDTNAPPGEIQTYLDKQQFQLATTNEIDKLHSLVIGNHQTVLFLKAHTLFNVYELCQEISALYPHVYIILIVPDNLENLRKAMLMGASDTLRSSYELGELSEAISHAKKFMQHRAKMDRTSLNNIPKEKSRVIAVSSPKGGVGRTVVSVNLAVSFARMGKKVAIIDANLQFGEVAIYNNVKPKRSIYEWVKEGYGREHFSITQYMTNVEGNVAVLAAPPRPEFFEGITEKHIREAIEDAKKFYDIILIDMPVYLSKIHLHCLDLADEILLLTLNELSSLRLAQLYLETLESINLKGKVKLVLNRFVKGQALELKRIEEILAKEVYHILPEHVNIVASSIKAGQPFILSNSRSNIGKSVLNLSEKLVPKEDGAAEVKKRKKWFKVGK
ncbi:AAA family ATPase [Neobacillus kokaensis]|uniref:AAA domain-containing protein n=1 Tax=Neobacillus kokaensis TaxID=2759023 RepID=A0ABQ3N0G4_9BACI|nr:AAA family ATPase [Neobacillus kokaensis]GHH97579.1 hypothetical protein AM1BK_11220 [Neobacillus kokaensis]